MLIIISHILQISRQAKKHRDVIHEFKSIHKLACEDITVVIFGEQMFYGKRKSKSL